MCLYPRLIKNPKYKANKKNGGVIPAISDKRITYIPIACKRCIECLKKNANDWRIRLLEDIKVHRNAKFITLTFSTESLEKLREELREKNYTGYDYDNAVATLAVRRFLERWRKKHKKSVRHWLVTELGSHQTEHIHLHGLIYTDSIAEIEKHWQYGYIWPNKDNYSKNYVNGRTINYITKYINKINSKHKLYIPIILTSPGIGASYTKTHNFKLHKYNNDKTKEYYTTDSGHKISLPIYYRNKIYTEQQREKLWIQKLDKETMYVCGTKIDVSNGHQEYDKKVLIERQRSAELGYPLNPLDEERRNYENARREIQQQTRLNKHNNKRPTNH